MKEIHYSLSEDHRLQEPIVQLSLDGVQESKSSVTSLDTYSVKFNHCRNIYPIAIIRPCDRYKYDDQAEFKNILQRLNANGIIIDCAIGDNPKRSFFRCAKCFGAKNGCEYCQNCAVSYSGSLKTLNIIERKFDLQERRILNQIEEIQSNQEIPHDTEQIMELRALLKENEKEKKEEIRKKCRKQLTWPSSTMEGNLRTVENITAITEEIERNPDIVKSDPEFCKGIKGRSLLLDQPAFHIIHDVPCEYMHSTCIGVGKRVVELTFKVGENRERLTNRKLSHPKLFNDIIRLVQLPRECSRRCRSLDFGVMKASEFRNIIIFFFPIVLDCIEDDYQDEKRIWLHLAFMIRACVIPNNEFRNVNKDLVQSACVNFYKLYEHSFGMKNCTYSIHVVISHLLKIRGNMPLTHRSAFKFESFFSEMRELFHPGTVSPLKQILSNCFVKRLLEFHTCEKQTFFSAEKKPKPGKKFNPGRENNHLVYVYKETTKATTMYSIIEIINENEFQCNIQGKFQVNMPLTPEYNWSTVGVYRKGPISEELHVINRKDISGKVIVVQDYLITCPLNVLHEQ